MAANNKLLSRPLLSPALGNDIEYFSQCNLCSKSCTLLELYRCNEAECQYDDHEYCRGCIQFIHQKKSHPCTFVEEGKSDEQLKQSIDTEHEMKTDENKELVEPEEVALQEANAGIVLEISRIECEVCREKYNASDVFICRHIACADLENCKICCLDCGEFMHKKRNKRHAFDPSQPYVRCAQSLLLPDEDNFKDAKEFSATKLVSIANVERILYQQRWLFAIPSSLLNFGGQVGASCLVNGAPTVIAACSTGASVVGRAVVVSALGGAIGVAASTFIEGIFIWRQYNLERISLQQALGLTAVSLLSNVASAGGWLGGMAIGALIGSPGGPIGVSIGAVIGGIVGALLLGFGTRYVVNKSLEYWYKHKNEARTEIQKQALLFFFGDKKYDIYNEKVFNAEILKATYHDLALKHHPDAPKNINLSEQEKQRVNEKWLQLSAYYGVLTGILDKMNKVDAVIQDEGDLDDGQLSMITNESIKNALFAN